MPPQEVLRPIVGLALLALVVYVVFGWRLYRAKGDWVSAAATRPGPRTEAEWSAIIARHENGLPYFSSIVIALIGIFFLGIAYTLIREGIELLAGLSSALLGLGICVLIMPPLFHAIRTRAALVQAKQYYPASMPNAIMWLLILPSFAIAGYWWFIVKDSGGAAQGTAWPFLLFIYAFSATAFWRAIRKRH